MAALKIPERYLKAYEEIAKMSEEDVNSICNFLETQEVGITPILFFEKFNANFPDYGDINLSSAIFSLGTLSLSEGEDNNVPELIDSLVNSYKIETDKTKENQLLEKSLRKNLLKIAESTHIITKSIKAISLFDESKNVLREAQIVADIRPIFESVIGDDFVEALVVHELRLTTEQNGIEKTIFINVNYKGLKSLQNIVSRAIAKEETIRKSLDKIKFVDLNS